MESSIETKERFGFEVRHQDTSYGPERIPDGTMYGKLVEHPADLWSVALPHKCESWDVVGGFWGVEKSEAIAELERFIAEAQNALEHLKRGEELDDAGFDL